MHSVERNIVGDAPRGRKNKTPEWWVFGRPVVSLVLYIANRLHWWVVGLLLLYIFSGITVVQPDQVGLVYRFGQLRHAGTAQAVVPPGILFAFPKPIDTVQFVSVQKVYQREITGLHYTSAQKQGIPITFLSTSSLDPEKTGYVLTGDGNIIHVSLLVNYQITNPIQYSTEIDRIDDCIDNIVQSAVIEVVGSRAVDGVLSTEREEVMRSVGALVRDDFQRFGLGIQLVSLEIQDLSPPYQVKEDFTEVQTADIEAKTKLQQAGEYRAAEIPKAQSAYNSEVAKAHSYAKQILSQARANTDVFLQIQREYTENPTVVHRRLLQEKLESTMQKAGGVQFIPPPLQNRYTEGFHIEIGKKQ